MDTEEKLGAQPAQPRYAYCAQCDNADGSACAGCTQQKQAALPSAFEPKSAEGKYLKAIAQNSEKTRNAQTAQTWYLRIMALCSVVLLIGAFVMVDRFAPVVLNLADQLNSLAGQTQSLVVSIAETDFNGLVTSTKEFVDTSSANAAQAFSNINSIDIAKLNESIDALSKIVTPLANLLGR